MRAWLIVVLMLAAHVARAEPGVDPLVPGNWVRTLLVGAMPVMQKMGTTWTIPMTLVVQDDYLGYDVGRDTIAGEAIDILVSGFYRVGLRFAMAPSWRVRPFVFGRAGLIFALNHVTPSMLNAGVAAAGGLGVDVRVGPTVFYGELGALVGDGNPRALTFAVGFGL